MLWLLVKGLSPALAATALPASGSDTVDSLVIFSVRQNDLWLAAQQQGNYAGALAISAATETRLDQALHREAAKLPAHGSDTHPQNLARLQYALALVYHQQGTSYAAQGSLHQLRSEYAAFHAALKNSAQLLLKSWELLQISAPVIGHAVNPEQESLALAALLKVAETYQLQGQLQTAQPLLNRAGR
ncbi:MAG: hypothetical protein R3E95_09130 [Thiolinea sp.]